MEFAPWLIAAFGSAFFAGITAILVKCGVRTTDSDVATAVRTVVVLMFAWLMAFIVGSIPSIWNISAFSLCFLLLSGVATGASWLCYFKALSLGDVNKVIPIDKTSTVLTILLAIVLFGELDNLVLKLAGSAIILVGTFLMIERKPSIPSSGESGMDAALSPGESVAYSAHRNKSALGRSWFIYAVLSAVFAALVAILSKVGFQDVESNLGTAIRTVVVLIMAWAIVVGKGKLPLVKTINLRELGFVLLSGVATGASWLCYYCAIQNGLVSVVVPIDKLSIVVSVAFSSWVLHEHLSRKAFVGLLGIVAGTMLITVFA